MSERYKGFRFDNGGDKEKLISILKWGGLNLGNNGHYFYGASNFVDIYDDDVNLTGTTDFSRIFSDAHKFNADISGWGC